MTFATGHHGFVSVAEESQYQDDLRALSGRLRSDSVFTARLVPESDNPHDGTAVAVCEDGSFVNIGYLPRGVARSYHPALARRQEAVTCPARLTGLEAGSIGVVLDFEEVRVALGLPRVRAGLRRLALPLMRPPSSRRRVYGVAVRAQIDSAVGPL
jgi:hypothetical protein